jgi:hypothetical protein
MQTSIELLDNEEILFDDEQIVVTTQRLIGNFETADEGDFDEAGLRDVAAPKKFNGGYHSRRSIALRLLAAGIAAVLVGAWAESNLDLADIIDALIFVAGTVAAMVGLYMMVNSLFRRSPNTTVIFQVFGGPHVIASYPEWDNPQAEELVRQFARAKRRTSY